MSFDCLIKTFAIISVISLLLTGLSILLLLFSRISIQSFFIDMKFTDVVVAVMAVATFTLGLVTYNTNKAKLDVQVEINSNIDEFQNTVYKIHYTVTNVGVRPVIAYHPRLNYRSRLGLRKHIPQCLDELIWGKPSTGSVSIGTYHLEKEKRGQARAPEKIDEAEQMKGYLHIHHYNFPEAIPEAIQEAIGLTEEEDVINTFTAIANNEVIPVLEDSNGKKWYPTKKSWNIVVDYAVRYLKRHN